MRRSMVAVVGVGGILAVGTGAFLLGAARWRRETADALDRLLATPEPVAAPVVAAGDELPAPVARYFEFALPDGAHRIEKARVRWEGEFRMGPDAAWAPFTATQHFTALPPGFVWDADIRMMSVLRVRVRDSYARGRASMLGRVAGLVPVVDQSGSTELAQSALARWLGEAVWLPTALLPTGDGDAVRWEPVDDSTARATVTDGAVRASAEFRFAPTGEIRSMTALRYRDVDGEPVLTPFEGLYHDYVRRDGFMVPGEAEVAWLLPEGQFAYWRGRPVEVRYEPAASAGSAGSAGGSRAPGRASFSPEGGGRRNAGGPQGRG